MIKLTKRRKIVVMIALAVLSILFGIFIYSKLSDNNIQYIISNVNNLNYMNYKIIILHLLLLSLSFIFSFLGVGIIFLLCYLCFEGIVIGFMSAYFISLYHISGFFYSIVYIFIYKAILLFLIIILMLKFLKITKFLIKYIRKEKIDLTKTILNCCIVCITIIINDFALLFFGNNILNFFSFIIK